MMGFLDDFRARVLARAGAVPLPACESGRKPPDWPCGLRGECAAPSAKGVRGLRSNAAPPDLMVQIPGGENQLVRGLPHELHSLGRGHRAPVDGPRHETPHMVVSHDAVVGARVHQQHAHEVLVDTGQGPQQLIDVPGAPHLNVLEKVDADAPQLVRNAHDMRGSRDLRSGEAAATAKDLVRIPVQPELAVAPEQCSQRLLFAASGQCPHVRSHLREPESTAVPLGYRRWLLSVAKSETEHQVNERDREVSREELVREFRCLQRD